MLNAIGISRWLLGAVLLGLAAGGMLAGTELVLSTPAQAQFWSDERYPFLQRQHQRQQRSGGFFQNLFGGSAEPERPMRERGNVTQHREAPAESVHAPPPRKSEAKDDTPPPSTTIVVMGDGMSDWLAYGLEDAFSDSPDVGIVRKDKAYSGLLRYDAKSDLDWWHMARDILAQQKASYVVMMLGVSDRQNIRERDLAKEAEKEAKEQEAKQPAGAAAHPDQQGKAEQKADNAAEDKTKRKSNGVVEFRSEQWEKIYTRRIDETIAALKSKGVPVFWVGLPSIRGTRSTADASYLNGLYRARAERAGIVYIDVWDGFVDDNGKYSSYGPDYEGQQRRLRSADGVYFTKYGARKLAHYVEREIRRYMSNRVVALPTVGPTPAGTTSKPTERPLAGPVVPLTQITGAANELVGGGPSSARVHGDALAAQVLVKGEPIPPQDGRADDFSWPPGSNPKPAVTQQSTNPSVSSATVGRPKPAATETAKIAPAAAPAQPDPPQPAAGAEPPALPRNEVSTAPAAVATSPAKTARSAPQLLPDKANATAAEPGAQAEAALEGRQEEKSAGDKPHAPEARHTAKPKPVRHERADRSAPRPPRPVQPQQNSGPFGGLFGVFR
jgi:hypothetical protein